jgi:hypothetical protein
VARREIHRLSGHDIIGEIALKKFMHAAAAAIFTVVAMAGTSAPVAAQTPGYDRNGCGWYIILGCSKNRSDANRILSRLGGAMAGGGAGSQVLNTSKVGGFRPGYFCVADGPYVSKGDASSVPWVEAVRDAYVKRGC